MSHDTASNAIPRGSIGERLATRMWFRTAKEPTLLAAVLYFWFTAVGFVHLFGTGQGIGVNLVDLASPSDFLVSGLRNPFVALLALVSGGGLYCAIGRAVIRQSGLVRIGTAAVGLLAACALLSGLYRHSATVGVLAAFPGSPCPLLVNFEGGEGVSGRIGAVTSGFVVIVRNGNETLVLPRDKVKSMRLDCSQRKK